MPFSRDRPELLLRAFPLQIKCRVHKVHVLLVQLFPQQLDGLAKTLEVDNLPFPKELDHVIYVRIIGQPQNIVIGDPCFLLWERIA